MPLVLGYKPRYRVVPYYTYTITTISVLEYVSCFCRSPIVYRKNKQFSKCVPPKHAADVGMGQHLGHFTRVVQPLRMKPGCILIAF